MITFDSIAPLDILYIWAPSRECVMNMPLCEVVEGYFSPSKSKINGNDDDLIVLDVKDSTVQIIKKALVAGLSAKLNPKETPSEGIGVIEDIVIQPAGEMMIPEVRAFLKKYDPNHRRSF